MNKAAFSDRKRILIFLVFAFGIAWISFLAVYLTGGIAESPVVIPFPGGSGLTLATILMATGGMWAPALAHVLTRLITREGWKNTLLRPRLKKRGWVFYILAWIVPVLLILFGGVIYFLLFPAHFDGSLTLIRESLQQNTGMSSLPFGIPLSLIVILQVISALLLSPFLNGAFTFGEEFGWRGYLLPKLLPGGVRKAVIISGIVWGLWHAPVIAMGYNYDFSLSGLPSAGVYPGAPWSGIAAMIWFCLSAGIFISWVTVRTGSVWPAVIAHGMINGTAALSLLFARGDYITVLGPLPTGVIGGAGFTLFALAVLLRPGALKIPET